MFTLQMTDMTNLHEISQMTSTITTNFQSTGNTTPMQNKTFYCNVTQPADVHNTLTHKLMGKLVKCSQGFPVGL